MIHQRSRNSCQSSRTKRLVLETLEQRQLLTNSPPMGEVFIGGLELEEEVLQVGDNVTDLDGLGMKTYHWLRDGVEIGATGRNYQLTQQDVGTIITAETRYTDQAGNDEVVTSDGLGPIFNLNDPPQGEVVLIGITRQGETLVAQQNLTDEDGIATGIGFIWYRDGTPISNTGESYVLTQQDVGSNISVEAGYQDGFGKLEIVPSNASSTVINVNDLPTGSVTIEGTAREGATLTATNNLADKDGLGTIVYHWKRDGVDITNAIGPTYTLTPDDVGTEVTVDARYVDLFGTPESVSSNSLGRVEDLEAHLDHIFGETPTGQWWSAVSNGANFQNQFVAQWPAGSGELLDPLVIDVTGDGKPDVVGRHENGSLYVSSATKTTFKKWGQVSPTVTWEDVMAADVNGDDMGDIVGRANGQWWVAVSQEDFFSIEYWGQWSNSVDWVDVQVGDFNGDGRDDIIGRAGGNWWVAQSTGQSFSTQYWGRWSNAVTWHDVTVGDFNGDGRSDVAGRAFGNWWVARATPENRFVTEYWGRWSLVADWKDVLAGDFNGDGLDDIAGRAAGDWWIAISSGQNSFTNEFYTRWANVAWADVHSGDFDGDGKDDLTGRFLNQWWVARRAGPSVQSEHWGNWGDTTWSHVTSPRKLKFVS